MLNRHFWLGDGGVLVRSIRTFSQTAIAAVGLGTTNLFTADIKNVLALASSAAILSILMSLDRTTTAGATVTVVETPVVTVVEPKLQAGYSGT